MGINRRCSKHGCTSKFRWLKTGTHSVAIRGWVCRWTSFKYLVCSGQFLAFYDHSYDAVYDLNVIQSIRSVNRNALREYTCTENALKGNTRSVTVIRCLTISFIVHLQYLSRYKQPEKIALCFAFDERSVQKYFRIAVWLVSKFCYNLQNTLFLYRNIYNTVYKNL